MTVAPPRSALDPRRSAVAPAETLAAVPLPEPRRRGFRLVVLVEIGLFLAAALALDWSLFDADRFADVQPHPFWIIVLIAALQYGTNEGLAAAAAATAALLVGNIPPPTIEQDIYDYYLSLSANPVMWLIAAVLIGEMRNRQIVERDLLAARAAEAERRNTVLAEDYRRLDGVREGLEVRVAGQMRTALTTYDAARALESNGTAQVLRGITELINVLLGPEKFSVFLLEEGALVAAVTEGWSAETPWPRRYEADTRLFEQVVGRQQMVAVTDLAGRLALEDQGLLAGPLLAASGEVVGMLKIEEMRFLQFNATAMENHRVLCAWIGTAYAKARQFESARRDSLFDPETNMFSEGFYDRQVTFLSALARRVGFDVTAVVISIDGMTDGDRTQFGQVVEAVLASVNAVLRTTDLVFDRLGSARTFEVLLPNTPVAGAQIVVDKLVADLGARLAEGTTAKASVTVLYHHEPRR